MTNETPIVNAPKWLQEAEPSVAGYKPGELLFCGDDGTGKDTVRPTTAGEKAKLEKLLGFHVPNGGTHGPGADMAELSPSRRLLLRLGTNKAPRTTPVEALGEQFFVRKLNSGEYQQVSMLANRSRKGYLNPFVHDQIGQFYSAVLFAAITTDEVGDVPFFDSYEIACDLVDETSAEARELVDALAAQAFAVNPDLLKVRVPTAKELAEIQGAEKKE